MVHGSIWYQAIWKANKSRSFLNTPFIDRFEKRKPFYDNCDIKVKITTEMSVDAVISTVLKGLEGRI